MTRAAAWVMNVDEDLYVSVSQMELVHILDNPCCVQIPRAPSYCNSTLIWNDALLPVIDIARLLGLETNRCARDVVAVTIYRNKEGEHHYGGIRQITSPELEYVTNDQICALPGNLSGLTPTVVSCFQNKDGRSVPILDMRTLFSVEYAAIRASQ